MVGRGLAVAEGRKTAGKGIECKVHLDPTYSKEPSFLPQMLQLQGVEVESSSAFFNALQPIKFVISPASPYSRLHSSSRVAGTRLEFPHQLSRFHYLASRL
jgi:hypothetical protein